MYGGIDLHARTMDGCILSQAGESMVHPHCTANPETFLTVIAPSRDDGGWRGRMPLSVVRAGGPVRTGGAPLHPRAGAVQASPPWRESQQRPPRGADRGRAPAWRQAPTGLGGSRGEAGNPCSAPAPAPAPAQTRCPVDACPADPPPVPLARPRAQERLQAQPRRGRRAGRRSRGPHERRGGPRLAGL